MKLFFKRLIKNINYDKLEPYKRNNKDELYLYSVEGIFKITKQDILKLEIFDCNLNDVLIDNIDFIMDNSSIKYHTSNKIPYDHKLIKKKLFSYY